MASEAYRRLTSGQTRAAASRRLMDPIRDLGFEQEVQALRDYLHEWVQRSDAEIRPFLEWQFGAGSKYFRPLTSFAVHMAKHGTRPTRECIIAAAAVEMLHNMSLVIDDILDESEFRRSKRTLHAQFGPLPGLMTAGIITADAFDIARNNPYLVSALAELVRRLGVAECRQWRTRRSAASLKDWYLIAGEDTGTMFEICANVALGNDEMRRFGRLLGTLYHGCDDVSDVLGSTALGGGGVEDMRDGIITLPMSIAIQDPATAAAFTRGAPQDLELLSGAVRRVLPAAIAELDRIAAEARAEAARRCPYTEVLNALIDHTRALAGQ
ncbi:MAG: polyprenyl synthetase family protein [Gammaproteobacteria bacterium]